jgi:hypothetical protein
LWSILVFPSSPVLAQMQIPNAIANFITIDPYGNIYAVKEAQLSKFSPQGKLLYKYSDNTLGTIYSVDVFNPMKIMLFYKDAGTLVFLNEQLTLIKDPISLFDANFFSISLASYSTANQIHLYDNTHKYLITLDFNMREISKTPINFPSFNPTQMIELEEKRLAMHQPEAGIFFFDAFGTFITLIPILTSHTVEVTSELIYYTDNNQVSIYNYKILNGDILSLSIAEAKQTLLFRNKMIVLLQNGAIWVNEL